MNYYGGGAVNNNNNNATTTTSGGPRAKCEQVVYEAMAKALEIVVGGRIAVADDRDGTTGGAGAAANNLFANYQQQQQSRFNVLVPEVPSVRDVLRRCRDSCALHVPLRLDVYLEEGGGEEDGCGGLPQPRRQLLERWCLEYGVVGGGAGGGGSTMERFLEKERVVGDPIVQLRHVCKRVVVWLRVLCCQTRLLQGRVRRHVAAAAANARNNSSSSPPKIGFSLYVSSGAGGGGGGVDQDVRELVAQGFSLVEQPSAVVTPYGELGWKVVCAPVPSMDLLESASVVHVHNANSLYDGRGGILQQQHHSRARPIPVAAPQQQEQRQRQRQQPHPSVAQSAPAGQYHHGQYPQQRIPIPNAQEEHIGQHQQLNVPRQYQQQQQQYHPEHLLPPRNHAQTYDPRALHGPNHGQQSGPVNHGHGLLQRRHTGLGIEHSSPTKDGSNRNRPPERVMSGLSLALLMTEEDESEEADDGGTGGLDGKDAGDGTDRKQRRAFHQPPPHVLEQQQHHLSSSPSVASQQPRQQQGAYGYAYNTHIPWQTIHPSTTNPCPSPNPRVDALSSTPPSMATVPAFSSTPSSLPHSNPLHAATPPFEERPAGFAVDISAAPLPPILDQQTHEQHHQQQQTQQQQQRRPYQDVLPPLTPYDLLHSSPFAQQPAQGSLLSSFSIGGAALAADSASTYDLRRSLFSASAAAHHDFSSSSGAILGGIGGGDAAHDVGGYYDDAEEMPFAVDALSDTPGGVSPMNQSSSLLGASAAAASFAQKLRSGPQQQRLQFFDRRRLGGEGASSSFAVGAMAATNTGAVDNTVGAGPSGNGNGGDVDRLAEQLAEFRSFGESLHLAASGSVPSASAVAGAAPAAAMAGSS